MTIFKDELKTEMKQEIATLRQDLDRKRTESNGELQEQKASITELEEWNAETNDSLVKIINQTPDARQNN